MGKGRIRAISALIVFAVLFSMFTGCSQGGANTAAEVGEKLELAIKYLSESNYEQAILAYQDVIKIDPKQVIAYKGIGLAYALQDKMDEAEQALQDGLTAIPGSQEITLTLAGLLVDLDRNDEAEKLYKELVEKDDTYIPVLKAYTSYLRTNDREADAITMLENAAAEADDYSLDTLLASLYVQTGETEKAMASIKASLLKEPGQMEAYDLLLDIYDDDLEGLLALADEYLKKDVLTGNLIKLAALFEMGDYKGLAEYYESLPEEIKTSPKGLYLAAVANLEVGNADRASSLIDLIQADTINDALLLAEIAQYYLDAGDKEKARLFAQAGIERDETRLENYLVLYRSYEGEDDAEARAWLLNYLIKINDGYSKSLDSLLEYDSSLINLITSELLELKKLESIRICEKIIYSIEFLQKEKEEWVGKPSTGYEKSTCYYDSHLNKAYYTRVLTPISINCGIPFVMEMAKEQEPWKNVICKLTNPQVYENKGQIANEIKGWNIESDKVAYFQGGWFRVISGDIPLEEHMKRAGIPLESVVFVDVE